MSNRLTTNHSTALKIDIDYSVIQYFDLCKKVSFDKSLAAGMKHLETTKNQ